MKYFIANHKNYVNKDEIIEFVNEFEKIELSDEVKAVIIPSNIYLPFFLDKNIEYGVQNFDIISPLSSGISINQIKSLGVDYCIVGHSDNRIKLNEPDDIIAKKTKLLIDNGITPILCFGEEIEVPVDNAIEYLINQLKKSLTCVEEAEISNIIFAYEPVWSISNGKKFSKTMDYDSLEKIIIDIKAFFMNEYSSDVRIVYGGSVNKNNVYELNKIDKLDGYLIGKSSVNIDDFKSLLLSI